MCLYIYTLDMVYLIVNLGIHFNDHISFLSWLPVRSTWVLRHVYLISVVDTFVFFLISFDFIFLCD